MRRRVVITGMGAITPLGHSVQDLYRSQLEGRSGVGPITHFNAGGFPTTFAAQVKDFDLERTSTTRNVGRTPAPTRGLLPPPPSRRLPTPICSTIRRSTGRASASTSAPAKACRISIT